MILGGQSQLGGANRPQEQYDEWIVQMLSNGQYTEAYRLLKNTPPQSLSTLLNLALCSYYAEEYESALHKLDEALVKLQHTPADTTLINDELFKKLERVQNADNTYLQGVTEAYVRHFPYIVKSSIIRIKIDCYLALCAWNKVIELAAPLQNCNYQNIEIAVAEASLHI